MKIRYCVIVMLLILVSGYFTCRYYINDENNTRVNMEQINDKYSNVVKQLSNYENDVPESLISRLEDRYTCEIIFIKNKRYETIVNNAIASQMVVMDYMKSDQLAGKIIFNGQAEKYVELYSTIMRRILCLFICVGIVVFALFGWIYWEYIRPFKTLQGFAAQISKGNLDFPLKIHKHNYFGAFTESFDIMREELKKARLGEYKANQSKKELVASLSHDIKTPVATIKAICEILFLTINDELVLNKVKIINQKAEVIDSLISNMFHATLEELKLLKINPAEVESICIPMFFDEINYEGKIHYLNNIPECLVVADKLRINQVIDNVINNSYKYASTDINVSFADMKDSLVITIMDYGPGVKSDESLLLTEKFYRGSNSYGKDGSGLGLYLAKQFMEGMKGEFICKNADSQKGFLVQLTLLKV